ncbi:MAG: substrate-binding domain-containing protein [Armatimonadetes bacterium]|nr:substrate-binding domain-containing protein [Armatimonadota bacterium]
MKYLLPLIALLFVAGCGPSGDTNSTSSTPSGGTVSSGEKPLVAFSQANSQDPWRKVFDATTKAEADKHSSEFSFEEQDASGDSKKQNDIIDTFMVRKPKILLVSPNDTAVTKSVEKAFDAGTSVILLDRAIEGDKYTCYIGGDNKEIGRQAGQFVADKLAGKGVVLMIQGIADATPTHDRRDGFMEVIKKYPGISVIDGDDCGYQRQKSRSYMETFLQTGKHIDCVYAHNDEMAIGARLAWDAAHSNDKAPLFVGIDGCQKEVVDMIKSGKLDATFQYPTPGAKGIEIAAEILKGNMPKDKKIILPTVRVDKDSADKYLADNPNLAP